MLTTPNLLSFLAVREGFREKVYDDKQPWLDLKPGDEDRVEGVLTYGHGLTRDEHGQPLKLGMTITEQKSFDRMRAYIRDEVEPVLRNLLHVPLEGYQYDALGSQVYQFGRGEVSRWRLWGRINRGEPGETIAFEWMDGTYNWDGQPVESIWKRRVAELLMFMGFDWRIAENTNWGISPIAILRQLGWDGEVPRTVEDEPEDPGATDMEILQYKNVEAAGYEGSLQDYLKHIRGKPGNKPLSANSRLPKDVPYGVLDPNVYGSQPLEEAGRVQAYVMEKKGEEDIKIATAVGSVASALATANMLADEVKQLLGNVGVTVIILALLIAGVYFSVGLWRKRRGQNKRAESEINATQLIH